MDSKKNNGTIFININNCNIEQNDISNQHKSDSTYCIICKKSEPVNRLLICSICKFNLVHIQCANIERLDAQNFTCQDCMNNSNLNNYEN